MRKHATYKLSAAMAIGSWLLVQQLTPGWAQQAAPASGNAQAPAAGMSEQARNELRQAREQARELRRARAAERRRRTVQGATEGVPAAGTTVPPPAAGSGTFDDQPPPAVAPSIPVPPATPALSVPATTDGGGAGEKAFNECIRLPRGRKVKVTLKPDSDLMDLVGWISSMTCKKFIVATSLRGQKVTLISPTAITPQTAYRAFLSSLEVMGLTVVPAGEYLKVVQANWALQSPIDTFHDDETDRIPSSDAVVTQILQVRYVDANELMAVLGKIKSRNGDITAYRPTNALIVTDHAYNVQRMVSLARELDVEVMGEKIWIVRMVNADAEQVLRTLQQIFAQAGPAGPSIPETRAKRRLSADGAASADHGGGEGDDIGAVRVSKMVADPTTNSLIVVASASSFARIASLIRRLDVEGSGTSQRIHVYYLENASAEDMATTLSSLAAGAGAKGASGQAAAALFEGDVKISSDKATNSLVIVASPKDFISVRRVIRQLDIPRRQVFVEAVIMEVSLSKDRTLGLSYHGGVIEQIAGKDNLFFTGLFPSSELNSLLVNPAALTGLAAGARGAPIVGSGKLFGLQTDIPAFGVLIQALQTNGDVNVLSSPHILTTDNEQAEITVGQNLPFQGSFVGGGLSSALGAAGGQAGALASSFLPTVSVQRQDVALKLKITPHVNDSDMVRLQLQQEVSDVVNPNFNNLGPATSKRDVKTTVVVRDQQTVVIGGLMADTVRENQSKIPLLGDIPILGYLFKRATRSTQKTNLLVVLTPYVIRDQSDLRRIFSKKLEERREFIERYTSFKPQEIDHEIDYRHKRGLLADIHRAGLQAEEEARMLEQAKRATEQPVAPLELPIQPASSSAPPPQTAPSSAGEPPRDPGAPMMPEDVRRDAIERTRRRAPIFSPGGLPAPAPEAPSLAP